VNTEQHAEPDQGRQQLSRGGLRAETADDLDCDIDSDTGDEADDQFVLFKAASKGQTH
jgi:hypothetical protein